MARKQTRDPGEGAHQPGRGRKRVDSPPTPPSVGGIPQPEAGGRAEEVRAPSQREIREILGSIQDGFFSLDHAWRFTYVNQRAAENIGLEPSELLGQNLWVKFPRIVGSEHEVSYRRAMEAREVQRFEMHGVLTEQWYSVTAYPSDEGISVYWQDISERKRAEEAVRRSTERFKLLSETAAHLLEAENPQEVVNDLCRRVMEHLDCQVFFHFLVDEATGRLHLNACVGIPEEEAHRIEWLDRGVAVCDCVARDGVRIVAEEILTHPDPRTEFVASYGVQAYACHPLLAQGKAFGTLSFGTKARTRFSEEDLSLMKTVADQVAVAMQRMQAQETLRRAHEELQAQSEELAATNAELRAQSVQLVESEQRLRMALEGGRMGRWEWDLETDSMFWCARTYELLGVDRFMPAAVAALLDRIHPDDRQTAKEVIAKAANAGKDFQAEFRVIRDRQAPRGSVAWLALHAQVIRDAQGQPLRTIGVLYDITARKQMEAELRRLNDRLGAEVQAQTDELCKTIDRLQDEVAARVLAEGRLRKSSRLLEAFFQHTVSPLVFLDRRFRFVRVNDAYARADGKNPDFFLHQDFFQLYPSAENRAIFEQVVRTKEPYHAQARLFAFAGSPQGTLRYWNWHVTPLLDDVGQVQFLVFSLEDVSAQQTAFGELEQRAHQLQKLTLELAQAEDRERRRLAEILHDDLQQVLAAAKFHLGLLDSCARNPEQARELVGQVKQMLKEAIEKSRGLFHELAPAVLYQSNLGDTFEWLAREVQKKHGLAVHVEVRGDIDSRSEALRAFLYRAAQELLFNMVKHAGVTESKLRVQRQRRQLWLTVSDRGRGFDPKSLAQTAGFGLLSIRERVELLGGRMRIRSARGRGTTILIGLPDEAEDGGQRIEDRRQTTKDSAMGRPPSSVLRELSLGSRMRVLLVDDHKVMREGLAAMLCREPDLEIAGQATNGREAVELARTLQPDVVVMDVALPMLPGDEATRQIRRHLPSTRVIGLSMFEEPGVAQRMRDAGADAYLPKTGPSENLLAAIRGQPQIS